MLNNAHYKYHKKTGAMWFVNLLLWPGTMICRKIGVDPEGDAGLVRSMFNMLVYLVVLLGGLWAFL